MSKKYAKGGRFDPSLTRSNVNMREKMSQIGAKKGDKIKVHHAIPNFIILIKAI